MERISRLQSIILVFSACLICSCGSKSKPQQQVAKDTNCFQPGSDARFHKVDEVTMTVNSGTGGQYENYLPDTTGWPPRPWPEGMVWIPGGEFDMGGVGDEARRDEFPVHKVKVDGFWMDATEVTVEDFQKFVDVTHYVTIAEKKPEWDLLKTQLPPGTPKPEEDVLVPGSLVFLPTAGPVPLNDYSQWWGYVPGASWMKPLGEENDLNMLTDKKYSRHPVVQVCWLDAMAYCKWAGKRLPSEAEWEFAARGGLKGKAYCWGDEKPSENNIRANLFQGDFPYRNVRQDGFDLTAPVKTFPPNGYGLFEMTGNVWEWCSDWYRPDTYIQQAKVSLSSNPAGPKDSYDPDDPYCKKRVVRGGSFLCNQDYCASYRPSARMSTDPYSGMSHTGFRCVMTQEAWLKKQKQR